MNNPQAVVINFNQLVLLLMFGFCLIPNIAQSQQYYLDLGRDAYQQEEYQNAIQYLEQARMIDSLQIQTYLLLGHSYLGNRQPTAAFETAKIGIRIFGETVALQLLKGESLLRQNRLEETVKIYEDLSKSNLSTDRIPPESRKTIKLRLGQIHKALGEIAFNRGVYSEAESHFEKSLQIIPDSLQSYTNLAKTYRINHKRDEALQLAEQGVQRFPTDPYLLRQKAELLKQKGAYSEAVDTYENLLKVDDSSKIHLATGELLEQLGYHTRALGHYRAAAASGRQNATAFFRAARILYKIGNLDESLQWSRKGLNIALQVMDHEQQSLKTLIQEESGWLHGENGMKIAQTIKIQQDLIDEHFHFINQNFDHKDSERIVKDLLNRHEKSAHLSMLAGRYYMDAGKMHEGHKLFKRSLLLNPKLAESHRALGAYYMERDAYRKAIRSYEKSLTLEPLHSETYASLINLYRKIGQLDRLCDRWLALYKSQSDNKTLRKHLIEALHKSDRLKEVKQVISMQ